MGKAFMNKMKALSLILVIVLAVSQPLSVLGAQADLDSIGDVPVSGELPYGLAGMPDDYRVSARDMYAKRDLADHGVLSELSALEAGVDYVEDEVLFLADSREYAEEVAAAYNAVLDSYEYGIAVLKLDTDKISVAEAVEAGMDTRLNLPPVEPNSYKFIIPEPEASDLRADIGGRTESEVADRLSFSSVYGTYADDPFLDPSSESYEWYHEMINTYAAWGVTTGSSEVTVAVIDSGVSNHEEFGDRLIRASVIKGAEDDSGHGTNVAGIIAAALGNGKGGAGIAPDVKLLSVPAFAGERANGTDILKCILYVGGFDPETGADTGKRKADIINMSLGGPIYSTEEQQIITDTRNKGVTILAAAGNEYSNAYSYPAAYDGVIAVAAMSPDWEKTGFSNYGSYVDIAAPGDIMWTAHNGASPENIIDVDADTAVHNEYGAMSGTSQATPVVAGACALYMNAVGHVDPDEMEAVLKRSTNKALSPGMGAGVIDLAKMFEADRSAPELYYSLENGVLPYTGQILACPSSTITSSPGINGLGGKIVYSVNGKAPAVLNGEVINGAVYSEPITPATLLSEYGITAGSKVKLMAAAVSGMGVLSDISSVTFITGGQEPKSQVKVKSITLSEKSIALKAGMASGSTAALEVGELTGVDGSDIDVMDKLYTWTSSNPKVVKVDNTDSYAVTLTAVGRGSAKIVCKPADGSKASAVCVVTVTQMTESINVTGLGYIVPGASAVYKAVSCPATVNSKAVEWAVDEEAPDGISITQKGVVTVGKDVAVGTKFYVIATAKDGSGISGSYEVYTAERALSARMELDEDLYKNSRAICPQYNKKSGLLTSLRMYTVNTPFEKDPIDESRVTLSGVITTASGDYSGYDLAWSSSNPKVVSVTGDSEAPFVTVKAHKAGKAVITCRAIDGSKKAASVVINVIVPTSGLTLTSVNDQRTLAKGCGAQAKASLGGIYGTPTVKNIQWDFGVITHIDDGTEEGTYMVDPETTEYVKKNKLASFKNGKLVISKKFDYVAVIIYAMTTDGTGIRASKEYTVVNGASHLDIYDEGGIKVKAPVDLSVSPAGSCFAFEIDSDAYYKRDINVNCSDSNVASATLQLGWPDEKDPTVTHDYLFVVCRKRGNAKIILTVNDGSNVKAVLGVKVK
ncbi:MAG: S8 family serine peptidase [Lachnospiraceae bacterium]|nr:S8 family serine peptidase [Lachnospiraceae bacterium]